jgi:hypothetical protein
MSDRSAVDQPTTDPRKTSEARPKLNPNVRLRAIERELQRLARRKLRGHELSALRYAALLQLRAEMAAFNGGADANSIVRLANTSRRARADYEKLIAPKPEDAFTYADLEREIAANA